MTNPSSPEPELAGKPTPGPWVVGPYGCVWAASDIEFRDGKWHERCAEPRIVHSPSKSPEDEANARLIAAAPSLVEALTRLKTEAELDGLDKRPGWDCWIALANEALALAREANDHA